MKLGVVKEDRDLRHGLNLGLVSENDTEKEILVFNELIPSVDPELPSIKLEMSSPLPGKGIVWKGDHKQHGHGTEQWITIGDAGEALEIFFDKEHFIRDKKYTF